MQSVGRNAFEGPGTKSLWVAQGTCPARGRHNVPVSICYLSKHSVPVKGQLQWTHDARPRVYNMEAITSSWLGLR